METDALVAHGAASVLEDRLFKCSDEFVERVCVDCGELGQVDDEIWDAKPKCRLCGSTNLTWMPTNYAWVVLVNELRCLSIRVAHKVKPDDDHDPDDHDSDSDHDDDDHDQDSDSDRDHDSDHSDHDHDSEIEYAIRPLCDDD